MSNEVPLCPVANNMECGVRFLNIVLADNVPIGAVEYSFNIYKLTSVENICL